MPFVFYDTETTGLRLGFDQIVHFAAIRTDNNLNEIERFEERSRLLPYVVPHPSALLTNGLPIEKLTDAGQQSHYSMVSAIRRKLLEWSPGIVVGYNSIRFDEEMLRHALFQTLHDAYLTSKHGNCRADAMGLALSTAALAPGVLTVPTGEAGRPTFRLDHLATANGYAAANFHDAMADAESTLHLCRLIRQAAPEVWQRFVRFSKKASVADFVDAEDGFILTEYFGNEAYHVPVVCIGVDPELPTRRLCLRLDVDLASMSAMSEEALQAALAVKPSPVRTLRVNTAPTLTELFDASEPMLNGLALDELEGRARGIKTDSHLKSRIVASFMSTRGKRETQGLPEHRLHEGFPDDDDSHRMNSFHEVAWPNALRLVEELKHEGLRVFGRRLVYCESRSSVPEAMRVLIEQELTDRLVAETEYGFTLAQALEEVARMLSTDSDRNGILAGYREYLTDRISRVHAFRDQRRIVPEVVADDLGPPPVDTAT